MAEVVYFLCAVTSAGCAVLLLKTYLRRRTSALLWGSLCFTGMAANNVLLFLDRVLWPDTDLSVVRAALGAASTLMLAVALAWDAD
jgi:hypothetical protein